MRTSLSARLKASPRSSAARSARTASGGQCGAELGPRPELANPAVTQLRQLAQRLIRLAERQVDAGPSRPQEPERRRDPLVASKVERYRLPRGFEIPAIEPDLAEHRPGHRLRQGHRHLGVEAEREDDVGLGIVELAHVLRGRTALPVSDVASARVRCPSLDRAIASSW